MLGAQGGAEFVEEFLRFGLHDTELAGETVLGVIQARDAFSGWGSGSGGVLRGRCCWRWCGGLNRLLLLACEFGGLALGGAAKGAGAHASSVRDGRAAGARDQGLNG
jgi:hypothetical protein